MSYFTNIKQDIQVDSNNSSVVNLVASGVFTGVGASTLGVAGIQVTLKTDQNCMVLVEQSQDNVNWDTSDEFHYRSLQDNFSTTVQAVSSYVRVVVTNENTTTATTYFRLQTVLCPIVEAVPRAVDVHGFFKGGVGRLYNWNTENESYIDQFGNILMADIVKLVGKSFFGNTKDPNFFTETVTGSGTVTQGSGVVDLATGVTANSTVRYQSVRKGLFLAGVENVFRSIVRTGDTGVANNKRNIGAFDANDGFFFQLDGTTVNIVTRKATVDTVIPSSSWNEFNFLIMDTNFHALEIKFSIFAIYFYIDGTLVHQIQVTSSLITDNLDLPVTFENINSGGGSSNVSMYVAVASLNRMGRLSTECVYRHISGASTNVLKYGARRLQRVVIGSNTGTTCTIYDNTVAGGTIIGVVIPNQITTLNYDCPFTNGLTVVTTGASTSLTIVWE